MSDPMQPDIETRLAEARAQGAADERARIRHEVGEHRRQGVTLEGRATAAMHDWLSEGYDRALRDVLGLVAEEDPDG